MAESPCLTRPSGYDAFIHKLATTQRSFYDEIPRFCKEELGMQQPIMGGIWRTANNALLLDMERWTYAGTDLSGKSHFVNSPHQNPPAKRRIPCMLY